MTTGSNLPEFRSVQLDFAAHIRNPDLNPAPADIEPRRMKIYLELFFNNIENFLTQAFPIAKEILGETKWLALAREFVHRHPSESPYFLQISEEFLTFLHDRGLDGLPPFLLELCHYEWVELSLNVAPDPDGIAAHDDKGDFMVEQVLNPHRRVLTYEYPVQNIGIDHQPQAPGPQPSHIVVFRNRKLDVKFMESNVVTHRLLALLESHSGAEAISVLGQELAAAGRAVDEEKLQSQGRTVLQRLRRQGIVLGSKV